MGTYDLFLHETPPCPTCAELKKRVEELETMLALSGKPISDDPVVTTTDGIEPIIYVQVVCSTCAAIRKLCEDNVEGLLVRIIHELDKAGVPGGKEK